MARLRCPRIGSTVTTGVYWVFMRQVQVGSPPSLVFPPSVPLYSLPMSIRKAGGDWVPLLFPIEPRHCKVCKQGLYRDTTMFRGGWSRCTVCDEFVHYGCLASGKVSFLKARPRVCKFCRAVQDGTSSPSSTENSGMPAAVGS
jgi:hypothetical protein